jgi:hypothetical protein
MILITELEGLEGDKCNLTRNLATKQEDNPVRRCTLLWIEKKNSWIK